MDDKLDRLLLMIFQSTLPQGERPTAITLTANVDDFNPRSRKGSDWFKSG